ncbi:MAG: arginase family protein [Egibacteraceae bacterium]
MHRRYADERGITVVTAVQARREGVGRCVTRHLDMLAERCEAIWVDLDVDVLDAAFAPGCPGARPGGLAPLGAARRRPGRRAPPEGRRRRHRRGRRDRRPGRPDGRPGGAVPAARRRRPGGPPDPVRTCGFRRPEPVAKFAWSNRPGGGSSAPVAGLTAGFPSDLTENPRVNSVRRRFDRSFLIGLTESCS